MKSYMLKRRTFLKGAGVSLALPFLNAMNVDGAIKKNDLPKRFACIAFTNGVSLPGKDHPHHKDWHWFPHGEGQNYQFSKTLESLNPLRSSLSVVGGLSHPGGRYIGAHKALPFLLTAAQDTDPNTPNSVSLDQVYAKHVGVKTRKESLLFSVNPRSGISYSTTGQKLNSENDLSRAFSQMFGNDSQSEAAAAKVLARKKSMLDLILDHSRTLSRKLGVEDQSKLDEYLSSVRETEKRVLRAKDWLKVPKAKVDSSKYNFDARPSDPKAYLQGFYDLMYLAFKTDTTRVSTFLMGGEGAGGTADSFSSAIGLKRVHALSHATAEPDGYMNWGKWDQFLAQLHSDFLKKLKSTKEGDSNLLDRSVILYGSATSTTHVARNYPLILAGGKALGLKHGSYHKFDQDETRLSDMYVTILNALGVNEGKFGDSTKNLNNVFLS